VTIEDEPTGADMSARAKEIIDGWEGDDEVEAVLAEFDGDPRKAIRALLDDIATLAEDSPSPLVVVGEEPVAAGPRRH
jgi:hypothetical protein